jgi:hypothetical protein
MSVEKGNIENKKKPEGADRSKSKVLKVVALRNRFFFTLYRYSTLVFLTSVASFIFSVIFLIFFAKQPVPPQYIPLNPDGTYIKMDPLTTEKSEADVQKFTMTAIKKLFKYDYVNYSEQLQDAASYFTEEGWNSYLDEYVKSNTLQAVKENKWIVTVTPESVPIIIKKGLADGIFVWEIQTKIQLMYVGAQGQTQHGDLYIRVARNSVINNPEGLGITKAIFQPK